MELDEALGLEAESPKSEHTVYELFKWSLILKGTVSVAEVVAGTLLLFIPATYVISLVQASGTWLSGYANNAVTEHIVAELAAFSAGSALYVAIYLLSRGLIKCVLIGALLKNIQWAYPASLIVLGLFLVYQAYEIFVKGSLFVVAITLFDIVVMYLIWREWQIVKRHKGQRPE